MVLGVLVGQGARGAGQPAVGERVPERFGADLPQLDEHGTIPVEVRDREKGVGARGEDGFFVVQVRGADGEDRSLGRVWSPNRFRSALLNGRSHAKALPPMVQVR
jgi:hypothetical protein